MENKYKEGATVYAKADPGVKLTVRRYVDRMYYCKVSGSKDLKDQVYFERELTDDANLQFEN